MQQTNRPDHALELAGTEGVSTGEPVYRGPEVLARSQCCQCGTADVGAHGDERIRHLDFSADVGTKAFSTNASTVVAFRHCHFLCESRSPCGSMHSCRLVVRPFAGDPRLSYVAVVADHHDAEEQLRGLIHRLRAALHSQRLAP